MMIPEPCAPSCFWQRPLTALTVCGLLQAQVQAQSVPLHLQVAREFVSGTRPENNHYSTRDNHTRVPGEGGSTDYVVYTDCSRFVDDVFRRAGTGVDALLRTGKTRRTYLARDWHAAIQAETAFTRVRSVADLMPGDVVAWVYARPGDHTATGHVLFVDSVPVRLEQQRAPVVPGLQQYELSIIDTSQEAKGRDDTRYVSDAALRDANEARGAEAGAMASPNHKGVGRGTLRFYADATGSVQGVAFNFPRAKFHGPDDWKVAMGRPRVNAGAQR